jgi:hypothetical protein
MFPWPVKEAPTFYEIEEFIFKKRGFTDTSQLLLVLALVLPFFLMCPVASQFIV